MLAFKIGIYLTNFDFGTSESQSIISAMIDPYKNQ